MRVQPFRLWSLRPLSARSRAAGLPSACPHCPQGLGVFLGNVSPSVNDELITELFKDCGEVRSLRDAGPSCMASESWRLRVRRVSIHVVT